MKKIIPGLVSIFIVILFFFGYLLYSNKDHKRIPVEEPDIQMLEEKEQFDVSGNDVRIIYNSFMTESKGSCKDGSVYLPLQWVVDYINDKYYWDASIEKVIYTYPDRISYIDYTTRTSDGKLCLQDIDGTRYILLDLIRENSPVTVDEFISGEVKRVFIDDYPATYEEAEVTAQLAMIYEEGSDEGRCVTTLAEGGTVQLRPETWEKEDADKTWLRVRTDTGFLGYVRKEFVGGIAQADPQTDYIPENYSSIAMDGQLMIVWHQVYNRKDNEKIEKLLEGTSGINVVSPTWFSLRDNDGSFESLSDADYVNKLHERGIQVWALVDNFDKSVSSEKLLSNEASRRTLIEALMDEVNAKGIDGINIDFEQLPQEAAAHYIQFLRELSVKCRRAQIVLSVDDPNAAGFNLHYNRHSQGECCDYVINMGYDEHYAGGEAGSVSSMEFFSSGLEMTLNQVPAEKVIAGIPFYTRIWTTANGKTESKAVSLDEAQKWIEDGGIRLTWNEADCQYYGETVADGIIKQIWLEDVDSLEAKAKTAAGLGVAGLAAWRLGMEIEEVWDVLKF